MDFKELVLKYGVSEDKVDGLLAELKQNKIFFSAEENMDVRYPKLKADNDANISKLNEANALIDQLKKSSKGNEDLQKKVTEYEEKISKIEEENKKLKIESATKVALLQAGGDDIDYLLYKLRENNDLKLNDEGNVDGLEGIINTMKTTMPNQFKSSAKKIEENKLDDKKHDDGTPSVTKEEFNKMGYQSRVKLRESNPELYAELIK